MEFQLNQEYILEVKDVTKYFHGPAGAKNQILENITFRLPAPSGRGLFAGIISPVNAGKTTLLKVISCIEKPNSGEIIVEGKNYNSPDGSIAYIPEKPSSFPWMNVKQNIEFALNVSNSSEKKEKINIDEVISIAGLTGYEDHYPHEKSSGFRFRISLARALAAGSKIILLDDIFKNLHGETKKEIINLIKLLPKELNRTFIFSTTNINEAILISDKLFLMSHRPCKIIKELDVDQPKLNESPENISLLKNEIEKYYHTDGRIPSYAE